MEGLVLASYLLRTQQLLQNPAAATSLYSTPDLYSYINTARGQIAGEANCVRHQGTLALTTSGQTYPFTAINTGVSTVTGINSVLNVRGVTLGVASGQVWLSPRPFPYFQLYYLNNAVPQAGQPREYSQYGQGEAGSIYFSAMPDSTYTATLDCVCTTINLVDDTTVEAIPYPWTDCVPYFAAYLAYLSAQRTSDADHMWQIYQTFMTRARQMANGEVTPSQFAQSANPVRMNQLGVSGGGGQ
jgi:hypothetical protein